MKTTLAFLLLLCLLAASIPLAMAREMNAVTAWVDAQSSDKVHLREKPSTSAKSLGLYFTGTAVLCDPATLRDEWVWVNVGTETGYINAQYLYFGSSSRGLQSKQPIGIVKNTTSKTVNLRCDASSSAPITGTLRSGDTVTILGETATRWYYIQTGEQTGYAHTDYITMGSVTVSASPSVKPTSVPLPDAGLSAYREVLLSNGSFINASDGKPTTLQNLTRSFAGGTLAFMRFAVVDLDGNGTLELVLWATVNGSDYGVEVLRVQNGVVTGYDLVYRAMMQLKTDGTFSYSNGAMDNGFGRLVFDPSGGYSVNALAYSLPSPNNTIQYFVDSKPSTASAYRTAESNQAKKAAVIWLNLTEANVNRALPK